MTTSMPKSQEGLGSFHEGILVPVSWHRPEWGCWATGTKSREKRLG